jgi:hypothetical protein
VKRKTLEFAAVVHSVLRRGKYALAQRCSDPWVVSSSGLDGQHSNFVKA